MTPLVLILVLTFAGFFAQTRNTAAPTPKWKQIRLMRSSRTDVEKLLGRSKYREYSPWYKVDDGVLHIKYHIFNHCTQTGADFKVPRWTVVEIIYEPDNTVKLSSLTLDLKKFRKVKEISDVLDVINYVSDEEGVDYAFQADDLISVRYFPGKRYDRLRCKKSTGNGP